MMSTWAAKYEKLKNVEVSYNSIGSAGGIQQMTAKAFDFGCTDAPMNREQIDRAREEGGEVVHVPLAMGAVVIVYSVKGIEAPLSFSGPILADIYLGKIKKWNDPAIKNLNPTAPLPDLDITVVHRSDGSGTSLLFTEYLSKVSPEWKRRVGFGASVNWPCGTGIKGGESPAHLAKRTEGAIGYLELTYALHADINYGSVMNRAGKVIKPSLESVTAAAKSSLANIPDDLRYSITDAPGEDAYPISGTTWAVIYNKLPTKNGKAIVDFLRWCTHEGQNMTAELHYARLPEGLVKRVDQKLDAVTVGD